MDRNCQSCGTRQMCPMQITANADYCPYFRYMTEEERRRQVTRDEADLYGDKELENGR